MHPPINSCESQKINHRKCSSISLYSGSYWPNLHYVSLYQTFHVLFVPTELSAHVMMSPHLVHGIFSPYSLPPLSLHHNHFNLNVSNSHSRNDAIVSSSLVFSRRLGFSGSRFLGFSASAHGLRRASPEPTPYSGSSTSPPSLERQLHSASSIPPESLDDDNTVFPRCTGMLLARISRCLC